MTRAPNQLQKEEFRFCRISKGKKFPPIDEEWQDKNNFKFNDDVFVNHLKNDGNYGVCTGYGGLVVIDCDDEGFENTIKTRLPKTFTVMSPNRKLLHFYFICPDLDKKIIFQINPKTEHFGEAQWLGQYVVGPSSMHPNGETYKVVDDIEIATIKKDELLEATKDYRREHKDIIKKVYDADKKSTFELPITNIIDVTKLKTNSKEYYGSHPVHGSTTEQNFWIDPSRNVWSCFRCDSGGGPLELVAVVEGIMNCEDAKQGALRGDTFLKVYDIAKKKYGLEEKNQKKEAKQINGSVTEVPDEYKLDESEFKEDELPWLKIMIESFNVFPGESTIFEIIIDGKKIKLEDSEILNPNKFRQEFFSIFGLMLSPITQRKWSKIISYWRYKKGNVIEEKREIMSDEHEVVESILNYINSSQVVDDIKYTFRERMIYIDGDNILIPTEIIKRIIERTSKTKISLRKLSYLVNNYTLSGSKVIKVGKEAKRFWVFDRSKFNIDISNLLSFSGEN